MMSARRTGSAAAPQQQQQPADMPGFPAGADIGQMMKYIQPIMKVAKNAPGILFGFFATLFFMIAVVGTRQFRESIAPVAGFHMVAFFIIRELIGPFTIGRTKAAEARRREQNRKSFQSDIQMQYREKLD